MDKYQVIYLYPENQLYTYPFGKNTAVDMNKKFKYFHSLVSVSTAKEASLILRYSKRNSVFR